MGAKGKRKCPRCGQWSWWTMTAPDGTCRECLVKELVIPIDKELIIVCLGNSLSAPEQETIWDDVAVLYDKLISKWNIMGHRTSQEIIAMR